MNKAHKKLSKNEVKNKLWFCDMKQFQALMAIDNPVKMSAFRSEVSVSQQSKLWQRVLAITLGFFQIQNDA
jgi:hypothetical protein